MNEPRRCNIDIDLGGGRIINICVNDFLQYRQEGGSSLWRKAAVSAEGIPVEILVHKQVIERIRVLSYVQLRVACPGPAVESYEEQAAG